MASAAVIVGKGSPRTASLWLSPVAYVVTADAHVFFSSSVSGRRPRSASSGAPTTPARVASPVLASALPTT